VQCGGNCERRIVDRKTCRGGGERSQIAFIILALCGCAARDVQRLRPNEAELR
jgi:hypothetical protein